RLIQISLLSGAANWTTQLSSGIALALRKLCPATLSPEIFNATASSHPVPLGTGGTSWFIYHCDIAVLAPNGIRHFSCRMGKTFSTPRRRLPEWNGVWTKPLSD